MSEPLKADHLEAHIILGVLQTIRDGVESLTSVAESRGDWGYENSRYGDLRTIQDTTWDLYEIIGRVGSEQQCDKADRIEEEIADICLRAWVRSDA